MRLKNYEILNSKQIKEITKEIKEKWGCKFDKKSEYVYLKSRKNKIYLLNRDIEDIDLSKIGIDSMGVYFAELSKYGIRFSIEGSELIGPLAKKNIVEIDDDEMMSWLRGGDVILENSDNLDGFVIVKHNDKKSKIVDYLGCGRIIRREDKTFVENFVPKSRKILKKAN